MSGKGQGDKPSGAPTVNTGGGAYIGGNVSVRNGGLVGRDQTISNTVQQGATLDDFRALLADLKGLLPQSKLPQDIATVVEGDVQTIEDQANKEVPSKAIITNKLRSIGGLLKEGASAAGSVEKILGVVTTLSTLAASLG